MRTDLPDGLIIASVFIGLETVNRNNRFLNGKTKSN